MSEDLIDVPAQHRGHTMFEIDCADGIIVNATIIENKLKINPNCIYISCLNKKAAMKKYLVWLRDRINEKYEEESHRQTAQDITKIGE